ncbi:MAG: hypothetical protein RI893_908 [Pseudomonadota bacterium]|jgi:chemotaxis protein CheZ
MSESLETKKLVKAQLDSHALYGRLGLVVRQLHDSLNTLGYERILDSSLREMSDSQDRLEYIATLTEQAADKVLNAVDDGLPIQAQQMAKAKGLETVWNELFAREFELSEIKSLASESRDFIREVSKNSEDEKARLMDIMMAQDFQDITGQIIKKLVILTQKLEKELAQLLRDYAIDPHTETVDLLAGPSIPELALDQDDVDSLLADLGF